jgi:hypothetical protein
MATHLVDKTGCLEACQKRCEELAAILWIQLKINGNCQRGQNELLLPILFGLNQLFVLWADGTWKTRIAFPSIGQKHPDTRQFLS